MPFRTKNSYTIPGKGTVTRSKSGKAKTYTGKGPAPAGTKKVREKSYDEVPTTIIQPGHPIQTSGMHGAQEMAEAVQAAERSRKRVNRITREVNKEERQRQIVTRGRKRRERRTQAPPKFVPASTESRRNSNVPNRPADKAIISSIPGKNPYLKGTPQQRHEARKTLRRAKKAVVRSGGNAKAIAAQFPELTPEKVKALAAAQRKTGTPAALLAAISGVESDYGRSPLPGVHSGANSAGAAGPFQIGNGTGAAGNWWGEHMPSGANIYDFRTAALGAGKYLHDAGATSDPSTWYNAALAYNHAGWYAEEVANKAKEHLGLNNARSVNPQKVKNLRQAEKRARKLGLKVPKPKQGNPVGPPPKKLVSKIVIAEDAMKEVEGTPYVWGGGHQGFTNAGGLDCSGAVSYVIHKVAPNLVKAPLSSGAMGEVLQPGPGALTVFYNSGHTFLRLINKKGEAEYWGTSVGDSGSGGLTRHPAPSAAYLSEYNVGHIPGMGKKAALLLGAEPGSFTGEGAAAAFPGMTLSPDGTTATINPGSGESTTKTKAGFSKKPIRLTEAQIRQRKVRRVKHIRHKFEERKEETEPDTSSVLKELEQKYGSAAV